MTATSAFRNTDVVGGPAEVQTKHQNGEQRGFQWFGHTVSDWSRMSEAADLLTFASRLYRANIRFEVTPRRQDLR